MAYLLLKAKQYDIPGRVLGRRCVVGPVCCVEPIEITVCGEVIEVPSQLFVTVTGYPNNCQQLQFDTFNTCQLLYASGVRNQTYQLDFTPNTNPLYDPSFDLTCLGGQYYLSGTSSIIVPNSNDFYQRGLFVDSVTRPCSVLGFSTTIKVDTYINVRLLICCCPEFRPGVGVEFATIAKITDLSNGNVSYQNQFVIQGQPCQDAFRSILLPPVCVDSLDPFSATIPLANGVVAEVTV